MSEPRDRSRIAFVAQPFDTLQPLVGGSIGIGIYQLASRLAKRHDVTVYCRRTAECRTEKVENGVRFVGIGTGADRRINDAVKRLERFLVGSLPRSKYLYYRWYYFRWYFYIFYLLAVALRIRSEKPDVVVIANFTQFVPIVKRITKLPVILRMHCNWLEELPYRIAARRVKQASAVVGCCKSVALGIQGRIPQAQDKCFVVYNGSNQNTIGGRAKQDNDAKIRRDLGLPDDDKVVLFVGRVTPAKGLHVLVKAMRQVLERGMACSLLVVGRPGGPPSPAWLRNRQSQPLWSELERLRSDYEGHLARLSEGMEDKVRFLGRVPHQELASYYELADVFVLPSVKNEAFPLVILEAMSCACPVVSTLHAGIPELVVHGETGLLVSPGEAEPLAEAMLSVLRDPALARRMGNQGMRRAMEDFTWERSCDAFLKVLGKLRDPSMGTQT